LAAGVLFYLWSLPAMLRWDVQFMNLDPSSEAERFGQSEDAVSTIAALTQRGQFMVTDHPYLAFLAQRLVPPNLADPSLTRVRARQLTGEDIVTAADEYDARLVVLWGDRLRTLRTFTGWLEERFVPVKVYGRGGESARVVYARKDADLVQARAALESSLQRTSGADFGGILRLRGYSIDRTELTRNGNVGVTYEWEALGRASVDYHIITELRGPDGQVWSDEELSLGGKNIGVVDWDPADWLFQTSIFALPEDAPVGEYVISVGVYDSKAKAQLPVTAGDPRLGSSTEPLRRFDLGRVRLR
jgi:hypothetical protein